LELCLTTGCPDPVAISGTHQIEADTGEIDRAAVTGDDVGTDLLDVDDKVKGSVDKS